jgi:hypothetical protein
MIMQLQPSTYYWKNSADGIQKNYGLIAQEVETVFPDLVFEFNNGTSTLKGINWQGVTSVLLKTVQEQQINLNGLKDQVVNINYSRQKSLAVTESISSIKKLTVTQSADFYGTITVIGEAGFTSKVTFSDHVYFNADTAGVITLLAGMTSTNATFTKPYEVEPIINITPRGNVSGTNFWLASSSPYGFTIETDKPFASDFKFNWQALAVASSTVSSTAMTTDTQVVIDNSSSSSTSAPLVPALPPVVISDSSTSSDDTLTQNVTWVDDTTTTFDNNVSSVSSTEAAD